MNPVYIETARLMAQIAPLVFADDTFALKGGTAINLFVRMRMSGAFCCPWSVASPIGRCWASRNLSS